MKRSIEECDRDYYVDESDDEDDCLILSGTLYNKFNFEAIYQYLNLNCVYNKMRLELFTSRPIEIISRHVKKFGDQETSTIYLTNTFAYSSTLTIKIKTLKCNVSLRLYSLNKFMLVIENSNIQLADSNQIRSEMYQIMDTFTEYLNSHNNELFYVK